MVLDHLFFGCILGGRLWNAGPIFLGLSMFFFFHVWLDRVFSGSRLKSERSMDSKSACEMFLLMFFAGSHFPRIKRGGPRSPGTKWRFPVGKFIELWLHWGKPCDARRHICSCLASLLRRRPKEARTERCNPGYWAWIEIYEYLNVYNMKMWYVIWCDDFGTIPISRLRTEEIWG